MNTKEYKKDSDKVYNRILIVVNVMKDYRYNQFCISIEFNTGVIYSFLYGDSEVENEFYFKLIRKLID